ncbi:hypothetical protein ACFWAR_19325 [Streptomyces sp. NPDC059917]|uniref:hypothetical protein n=1 Tax=Streptomyces sp. NPDC059917 TaxID=3347002 RepID=UPI0036605C3A
MEGLGGVQQRPPQQPDRVVVRLPAGQFALQTVPGEVGGLAQSVGDGEQFGDVGRAALPGELPSHFLGTGLHECGDGADGVEHQGGCVGDARPWGPAQPVSGPRLSPLKHKNLNVLGRYSFTASPSVSGLRPLRAPDDVDLDDDDDGAEE